jgi:cobalt-zinc-cadmium efflux system protein
LTQPHKNKQEDNVEHGHGHCHDHHDHAAHADLNTADGRRRVAIAGIVTALFMVVETIGGIISGSLALLADAAHMFTDAASLALAWLGYVFAAKPADDTRPFGFGRMRVLAAFINGLALLALSAWIVFEGAQRLLDPQPVRGSIMLWIAIGGLAVNLVSAAVLHGGDKHDINLSGALWHVIGDLLGSVAAIVAAIIIIVTDWTPIDPLLSMLVALLILIAGIRITRRAGHILAQGAPPHLTPASIRSALTDHIQGIEDIPHVYVWLLTEDKTVVTVEINAATDVNNEKLRQTVKQHLLDQLHVHLATVEIVQRSRG